MNPEDLRDLNARIRAALPAGFVGQVVFHLGAGERSCKVEVMHTYRLDNPTASLSLVDSPRKAGIK